jgi:hypothetical protein
MTLRVGWAKKCTQNYGQWQYNVAHMIKSQQYYTIWH